MALSLKPVASQVIVVTGASSGIGLATARMAAARGAKVVLSARSGDTLDEVVRAINDARGDAIAVTADVAERSALEHVADAAISRYGRIDTWVNNAGVGIYGRLDEVSEEDSRRMFDTDFWGVVNGSLVALKHLRARGGAILNVGSEVSEAVAPLLGMYTAAKHAVKGFTDTLRVEVEELDKAPVAVTLIEPTATDTPFPQHARNYQTKEAKLPTPRIEPEEVAAAILGAAERHAREVRVGLMAKLNTATSKLAGSLGDKLAARQASREHYDEAARDPAGALHRPAESTRGGAGQVHGSGGVVRH